MIKNEIIEEKIKKYELFVEEKLKTDLRKVDDTLLIKNKLYQEWEEVENMCKTIQEFKEKDRDMLMKLELGDGVLVQGEVTNFNDVFIDIGLGHILKMEPDEAIKYAGIRKRVLKKEVEHYRKLAVDIKVHIKFVLLAISELQSPNTPP
ncbi:protein UXT homolog [Coccinella septempunctata]|uniref:protein UXT homolog n=1 Tax=Coccinella septempunctata TaxID=41139 RepID=UPI001D06F321|nr:protein UXT homolog [Coccinella septempunctata]